MKSFCWAGEMAQQSREIIAFPETGLDEFPAPTGQVTPVTPVPGDLLHSTGLHEHCMHVAHRHKNTHIKFKKEEISLKVTIVVNFL